MDDMQIHVNPPPRHSAVLRIGIIWGGVFIAMLLLVVGAHTYGPQLVDRVLAQNPRMLYQRAFSLYNQKQYAAALTEILDALAETPNNHKFHYLACNCYTELGERESALEAVNAAIDNAPSGYDELWRYYERRGDLRDRLGRRDQAVADWRKSAETNPENANLYFKLAKAHAETGDYREAHRYIGEAIKRDRNNAEYMYLAGYSWMKEPNFVEAAKCFERLLELAPTHEQGLYNIAVAEQQIGHLTMAETYMKRYLELRPDDENAKRVLRRLQAQLHR